MIAASPKDIGLLRVCGRRLAGILRALADAVRPGISTAELDQRAEALIRGAGGAPAFKGYRAESRSTPYPASICVSVNSEVVHGIPRPDRIIREGDIVGIDVGMRYPASGGLITDTATTVAVGTVDADALRLIRTTERALGEGIAAARASARLGDIGHAIQSVIESEGFGVVRELVGHGVGKALHEKPYIPNFGDSGRGDALRRGSVIAIEPMATIGSPAVTLDRDGWTWKTADGSRAAHFEHTVLITANGAEILTAL